MSRIAVWLAATAVLMVLLTGYQLTVAGGGGGEEGRQRPAVTEVRTTDPSGAPAAPSGGGDAEVHPPK